MKARLERRGMSVSRKRVQRLMRAIGLRAIYRQPHTVNYGLNGLLKKPVCGGEVVQGQDWISAKVQQEAYRSRGIGGSECSRWECGVRVDLFRDSADAPPSAHCGL